MKMRKLVILAGLTIAACAPVLMTRAEAVNFCQQKAREAAGPTGKATVGLNSQTGPSFGLQINLSDAFLRGLDPAVVYENCMNELSATGQIMGGS